jgi:hypothetical protein
VSQQLAATLPVSSVLPGADGNEGHVVVDSRLAQKQNGCAALGDPIAFSRPRTMSYLGGGLVQ